MSYQTEVICDYSLLELHQQSNLAKPRTMERMSPFWVHFRSSWTHSDLPMIQHSLLTCHVPCKTCKVQMPLQMLLLRETRKPISLCQCSRAMEAFVWNKGNKKKVVFFSISGIERHHFLNIWLDGAQKKIVYGHTMMDGKERRTKIFDMIAVIQTNALINVSLLWDCQTSQTWRPPAHSQQGPLWLDLQPWEQHERKETQNLSWQHTSTPYRLQTVLMTNIPSSSHKKQKTLMGLAAVLWGTEQRGEPQADVILVLNAIDSDAEMCALFHSTKHHVTTGSQTFKWGTLSMHWQM